MLASYCDSENISSFPERQLTKYWMCVGGAFSVTDECCVIKKDALRVQKVPAIVHVNSEPQK